MTARHQVRLVGYAWGRSYVDDLLDFALSAALAPGNLPALAAVFDCTAVIVTEEKLFNYVRAHPTAKRLQQICPVKLIPLDDLVSDPWQYGITVAYALFRGFEDLGPAMTETYILFLNADFILADGSYRGLIDRIRSPERVHLAPSYCTVEEQVRPLLRKAKKENGGVLAIAHREMAALILSHPHNTVRAKTVNQSNFEFEHADQFYWKFDSHTLIGHQMPVALIGMRPERTLSDLNTFWDWGIVYEFCPSMQLNVLGDSDDFLILELRSGMRSMGSIRLGRSPPKETARRLMGHITQYQLDNARFELLLHSRELPSNLTDARSQLRSHVDEVLSHLPSVPNYHRHRQWIYHLRHYRWRVERNSIRVRMARIASEIEVAQGKLSSERELIDEHLSNEEREQALQYLEAEYADTLQPLRHELALLAARLQTFNRVTQRISRRIAGAAWVFSRRIAGAAWVYRLPRHRLRSWINQRAQSRTLRILVVCPPSSSLFGLFERLPGCHMYLTPESITEGALHLLPQAGPTFDMCVVELVDLGGPHVRELLHALAGQRPQAMFVHWHDRGSVPLASVHTQVVQFTLERACRASGHYAGSWASVYVTQAVGARTWRRLLQWPAIATLAVVAELVELTRRKQIRTIPKYSSSAIFRIDMPSEETIDPLQGPIGLQLQQSARIESRGRTPKTEGAAQQPSLHSAASGRLLDERTRGNL